MLLYVSMYKCREDDGDIKSLGFYTIKITKIKNCDCAYGNFGHNT